MTVYVLALSGSDDGESHGRDHSEALALSIEWDKHRDDYLKAAQTEGRGQALGFCDARNALRRLRPGDHRWLVDAPFARSYSQPGSVK
jgi:hypothetical protein